MAVENQEDNVVEEVATYTETVAEEAVEEVEESGEAEKVTEETETEDDDVVVTIGEDSPPEEDKTEAPEWVRELRKTNREKDKKIRELEGKLNQGTENKPVTLATKPTLEGCEYDDVKFEAELTAWFDNKKLYDDEQNKAKAKTEEQNKNWQAKLDNYNKAKDELKVKNFDDVEAVVTDTLSTIQQSIIVKVSKDPALLVYAIGSNPEKAKELSQITDPVEFAHALGALGKDVKVTKRKAPPSPETKVKGTASVSGSKDKHLEKLREEAANTGNYTKVTAYKKQLKKAN